MLQKRKINSVKISHNELKKKQIFRGRETPKLPRWTDWQPRNPMTNDHYSFTDFLQQRGQNNDKHLNVSIPEKVETLFEIDRKAVDYRDSQEKSIKWLNIQTYSL